MRPARVAIAGDTGIGDSLPRSRPTFAAWSNVSILAAAFLFAVAGASWQRYSIGQRVPVLTVVIGGGLTLGLGVPLPLASGSHRRCDPFAISPKEPNVSRPVTTADGCRWFRTMTSVRCRRRSTDAGGFG